MRNQKIVFLSVKNIRNFIFTIAARNNFAKYRAWAPPSVKIACSWRSLISRTFQGQASEHKAMDVLHAANMFLSRAV